MAKALYDMGNWYCNNVYTYNPYSTTDFTRNNQPVTFSGRFEYDYGKASKNAKHERELRVNAHNMKNPLYTYEISKFVDVKSYNLALETFIGHYGDHALYACELLDNPYYSIYKDVGDDCSSFTMAVMYYATQGAMDEYEVLNIYNLGSGALLDTQPTKLLYEALKDIGFEKIPVKNGTFDELQSGDILVSSNHYEFFYITEEGKKTSFGWGSVKNKFPNERNSLIEMPGNPYFWCKGFGETQFKYIYRLTKGGCNEE